MSAYDVEAVRRRFSALGGPVAFFDTPGGTQVPDAVRDAVATAMRDAAANLGGRFATSLRAAEIVTGARAAAGRFLGCAAEEVVLGANMSTLNFALTRTFARELEAGDEVLVTRLDHDAGVSPWMALAEDLGIVVRPVDIDPETCRLDLDDLERQLSPRTRVVAFAWAANSVGTIVDAARVCELARAAGALAWIDATHAAAHVPVDVEAIGADVLLCSPYKFCGPHLGLAYVRAQAAAAWRPYKVRPAPSEPFGSRFETGTGPYEQLAGLSAALAYWAEVDAAGAGHAHARALGQRFLDGLPSGVRVVGPPTMEDRVPTFLLDVDGRDALDVADGLIARDLYASASDGFYCVLLKERIGLTAATRVGLFHYTTADEVDRLLAALGEIAGAGPR
ncbi:MAG TPA: aminotransferase class V-fold PLP-dependent enzyme [Capillimicrobium sp.]|jgi:cysteine desulfurase family protein (TIGR01976 family)